MFLRSVLGQAASGVTFKNAESADGVKKPPGAHLLVLHRVW